MEPEAISEPQAVYALPPGSLADQLDWKFALKRVPLDKLACSAGVSYDDAADALDGKGLFAVYCQLVQALGLTIDFRSWDYQRIMPLEESTDPKCVCAGLTGYYRNIRCGWGSIPVLDESAIYWAEPNLRLRSVAKYLKFIDVSARLVDA